MNKSDKKYGLAVCLCAVFGVLGIHHFYLGRWAHGLLDFSMTIAGFGFLIVDKPVIGFIILGIDYLHTLVITILLLIGSYKDGRGNLVCFPGQKINQQQ
jgi:TM2 domain-containing membrane protein YozV